MTIPTAADLLQILRASPDVRAAAAALLALAPAPVPAEPEAKEVRRARLALQRALRGALPEAYHDPLWRRDGIWALGLALRVPKGTPGSWGSYLRFDSHVAALLEETPDGR